MLIEIGFSWEVLEYTIVKFAFVFILNLFIGVLFSIFCKIVENGNSFLSVVCTYFFYGIPISVTGYVTGLLTGLSSISTTSTVLPAALAFIGGINIYIFGADNKFKVVVGYCVTLFVIMLFIGIDNGAMERERGREEYLEMVSQREFRIRNFRENLGLPKDIPDWSFSGRSK